MPCTAPRTGHADRPCDGPTVTTVREHDRCSVHAMRDLAALTWPELDAEIARHRADRDAAPRSPRAYGRAARGLAAIGSEIVRRETLDPADLVERPEFDEDGDVVDEQIARAA